MSRQEILDRLDWRSIGPTRGGRVTAVSGDPAQPGVFYFGSTGGGVWKTDDAGTTWQNTSDGYFRRASVGALAVAPSDPNVIYAGMGETTIRGNVSHGDGIYKSTDAGQTWQHVGLGTIHHIGRVVIHPTNPDLVYVAAFGHAWGPSADRGVYRSKDGGATWDRVLFVNERTGANFLAIDPTNPRILYACFWEAQRGPYYLNSGGPGSAIFRSTDGGDTWQEITNNPGMPEGNKGKMEVAVAASGNRIWAIVEADPLEKRNGVYRSEDRGETWQQLSSDTNLTGRPWYFNHIRADPRDPDTVWVLNFEIWRSVDGGKTYSVVAGPHADYHDLWIDPVNTDRMILGGDGGGCVSFNGGQSWSTIYNQPTGEFYHAAVDTRFPYRVYGAQQDNTTMSVPSRSVSGFITTPEWYPVGGGESGYIAVKPDDHTIVYAGSYGGLLTRYDAKSRLARAVSVWPEMTLGSATSEMHFRFNWTSPTVFSPHDPNVLYTGGNHV
ncbi:MAG TPA: glycosyl hydrolase, partial [Thermomicrobiales bacterium]|nr:glycosyl hydrolase [Thermomicrobiales bacterium]